MKDKTIPEYYGGEDNPYEAIKVINAWGLGFELGNVCKYIARAGKKDKSKHIEDLEKAKRYLELEITKLRDQEQVYILKDTGNIFMQNSDLGTGHLEKAFWANIKTAVGCGKPDDNKETVALLDQALEEMDEITQEELVRRVRQGTSSIQVQSADGFMPFIDSQSTPEEIEKFVGAWKKESEAAEVLRKCLKDKFFDEKETQLEPSTIVAISRFKYGQEVWFLENSSIGHGEVRGFKIEQYGPKPAWEGDCCEVYVYETAGNLAREIWIKEKNCFESRRMLINSLNEQTDTRSS